MFQKSFNQKYKTNKFNRILLWSWQQMLTNCVMNFSVTGKHCLTSFTIGEKVLAVHTRRTSVEGVFNHGGKIVISIVLS